MSCLEKGESVELEEDEQIKLINSQEIVEEQSPIQWSTRLKSFSYKYLMIFCFLLLSGIGSAVSGLLLDHVIVWEVFTKYKVLMTLVPPLISLIGNTMTTFASRISTQVNVGKLDTNLKKFQAAWGNFSLVLCQSSLVGALAGIIVCFISSLTADPDLSEWLFVIATCICCTTLTVVSQTVITIATVYGCAHVNVDPDNFSTPLVASIADVSTLAFMALISWLLFDFEHIMHQEIICASLIGGCALLLPVFAFLSFKNEFTKEAFSQGWCPIISGILISGAGGQILGYSIRRYSTLGLFQPYFNGLCGNIVSIISSKTATHLNKIAKKNELPKEMEKGFLESPFSVLFSSTTFSRTARRLLTMTIPAHLIMGFFLHKLDGSVSPFGNVGFLIIFLASAFLMVALALYITNLLIKLIWIRGWDPDTAVIPIMTALSDLLGVTILFGIYALDENIFKSTSP